jgi:peptidoglycan/LPS O-acetylase OafA/YrhL
VGNRDRWTLLDGLRGVAAICVVLWHWLHFSFMPDGGFAVPHSSFPMYAFLRPAYDYGWIAVDLFFVLSGFVFFGKYEAAIQGRKITPAKFFWLRFARLYPLHLATLMLVAGLQAIQTIVHNYPFVYSNNDAYHFGLNLLLISEWGFQKGFSFNGPAASISIEILLYGIFFVAARRGMTRTWCLIGVCCVAMFYLDFGPLRLSLMARGVLGFFVGGIVFRLANSLAARRTGSILVISSAAFLIGMGLMVLSRDDSRIFIIAASTVAFPSLMLVLLSLEDKAGGRLGSLLGEISYSSYMLHFPLQLSIALLPIANIRELSTSIVALCVFFAALLPLSFLSNRFVERPAQRLILRKSNTLLGTAPLNTRPAY